MNPDIYLNAEAAPTRAAAQNILNTLRRKELRRAAKQKALRTQFIKPTEITG